MNKEKRDMEEALARSVIDKQRLETQMNDHRARMDNHLKATSNGNFSKLT